MFILRRILTDEQLEIKYDESVVSALRIHDPDIHKPTDVIRRHKMSLYQFTYLMVAMVGKAEAILRFQIVQSFTDAVLDPEDNEMTEGTETEGLEDSGINMQYAAPGSNDSLI
jgi:hypothetical protein